MNQVIPIFLAVFVAELGDKTQIATLLFATDRQNHPLAVFLAAAAALIAATALAVACGTLAERYLSAIPLQLVAGLGFIAIGIWTLWGHVQA
jgi:putative Ca2+/H+ antiporter (TMEM165/GDT1 family)